MSLKVGIVGLPNVGKSTLFNALLRRQQAYVANFPFATIEPNIGVVPVPEISPEDALKDGAFIVASGRSDYPNQINNVLAFPGVFRGALNGRATNITVKMKTAAAYTLAGYVKAPSRDKIIPDPFERGIAEVVAKAIVSSM